MRILAADGRNIRDDRQGLPSYSYGRKLKGAATVASWRDGRFRQEYPGFDVQVLFADGSVAHGRTQLATVRSTYG